MDRFKDRGDEMDPAQLWDSGVESLGPEDRAGGEDSETVRSVIDWFLRTSSTRELILDTLQSDMFAATPSIALHFKSPNLAPKKMTFEGWLKWSVETLEDGENPPKTNRG